MGLMAFSSLISCTRTVELPTVTKQRNTSPGADGRIVIWIDPIKAKKGELSSVEKQLVEKINELDPNSDTDRLALLTHLDDERWFVRREVIVVLGESNDPKVLLNLVPSTRDPHWIVANESSGQLLSKQTAIRSKVFELGIESDQASLRNITARSWSVLVDSNRLQTVDDPILITEFLKSSCRLFSSEQMASYGASGDPAILSLVESCTISAKGLKTATPVAILRAIQSASPRIVFAGAFSLFRCGTLRLQIC